MSDDVCKCGHKYEDRIVGCAPSHWGHSIQCRWCPCGEHEPAPPLTEVDCIHCVESRRLYNELMQNVSQSWNRMRGK